MKYLVMIMAAGLLKASTFANPVPGSSSKTTRPGTAHPATGSSASTVTCLPIDYTTKKVDKMKVSVATAKAQMKVAGLQEGRSGDPHRFYNSEKFHWNVPACDKPSAHLMEYPVFHTEINKTWQKDVLNSKQKEVTAIRVVFANSNGISVYCGIMVHELVKVPKGTKLQKAPDFIQCH